MKFEKLNGSNGKGSKMFLCGLILGVSLLIVSNLFLTKAKYKVVDSAKLVNSTINYSSADLNVIAMYKNDGEKDELIKEVPEGYYDIDEERSYCKVPDSDNLIKNKITYDGKEVNIKITKKGTKCYVYFIPAAANTLADLKLKSNTEEDGCPAVDKNGIATITEIEDTKKLICSSIDDYGETYYFRGQADNNWVKIGETYWRIIRINGNGTIRLIYNGKTTNTTGEETLAKANIAYNKTEIDNAYVGFKYGSIKANKYEDAHTNANKSNILTELDTWYLQNLNTYENNIDKATGFCNDRTPYNGSIASSTIDKSQYGFETKQTYYGAYIRAFQTHKPVFKCPQQNDLFTTTNNEGIGNQQLEHPIGLITMDEVMYAGAYEKTVNTDYYLHTGQYYWTMSPTSFNDSKAWVLYVTSEGYIDGTYVNSNDIGMRPVINLKKDLKFKGNGTVISPFEII